MDHYMVRKPSLKLSAYLKFVLSIHVCVLIVIILYVARVIFIPLFFAFLVAVLVYPIARYLERRKIHRSISCVAGLLVFIALIGILLFFFTSELKKFGAEVPQIKEKAADLIHRGQDWLSFRYNIDQTKQKAYLDKSANDMVSRLWTMAGTTLKGFIYVIIESVLCLIFIYFILYYRELLMDFLTSFFNASRRTAVKEVVDRIRVTINGFVRGLFFEMLIVAALVFVGLSIFGIQYALMLALTAAMLNIIPYLGFYTAGAITALIAFGLNSERQALEAILVFAVVHLIDANLVVPKIVGGKAKMNPFVTIIAVFSGHLVWGLPGMFLFIPLAAILRIVTEAVPDLRPISVLLGDDDHINKAHSKVVPVAR